MKSLIKYIEKQKKEYVLTSFENNTTINTIVVIPCYNEQNISTTINNIYYYAKYPQNNIGIIVIINSSETSIELDIKQNEKTYIELNHLVKSYKSTNILFNIFNIKNLPKKQAGVGFARKIGMDSAIKYFINNNITNGIIISLDADCTISNNFFNEIINAYKKNINATIHNFKHRIENDNIDIKNAIKYYEEYIKYFSDMLKISGFPYYLHTIGSTFSISAKAYVKVGGMGKQQAGEDFYFLQKIFALEKIILLKNVFVYPLARYSYRIPFGTGPALKSIIEGNGKNVYNIEAFADLKELFKVKDNFFKLSKPEIEKLISALPESIKYFIKKHNTISDIIDCNNNCSTLKSFRKRFFSHFNCFKIIKFLNETHPLYYKKQSIANNKNKYNILFE